VHCDLGLGVDPALNVRIAADTRGVPTTELLDFSAGIWRGRKAPSGAVYDAVNGLVDSEGNLIRRGAAAYKSNANAGGALTGLTDMTLLAGQRTVFWRSGATHALASDDATPSTLATTTLSPPISPRMGTVAGIAYFPLNASGDLLIAAYAGSRKAAYSTGTATVTSGSRTVTGSGTSWLANADAGMFLQKGLSPFTAYGPVSSVESDTSLTLAFAPTGSLTGGAYTLSPFEDVPTFSGSVAGVLPTTPVSVTDGGQRVLVAYGSRVYFSEGTSNNFPVFTADQYHELPGNAIVVGSRGIGESAWIFTTAGTWRIDNLAFDAVDDAGNPQRPVEKANDIVLLGDAGLADFHQAVVVPAVDDIYLLGPDGSVDAISEGIRPLWQQYVAAGYAPGTASTHRGHYFLPILNGAAWVDTLVCRLDRPTQTPSGRVIYPWTRWTGQAAGVAYAQRIGSTTRTPKLLGLSAQRVTDLTATLDGQGATDADSTDVAFTWTTNDIPLANGTAAKVRGRYELVEPNTDIFNRPDETGLSNGWLTWTSDLPDISAGAAVPPASTFGSASRPESIGPNSFCQAVYTEPMDPTINDVGVAVRLTAHSGSANGYSAGFASSGHLHLWKGSGFTQIASSTGTYSSVEGIRIVATGSTIEGYVLQSGSWVLAVTVTDATYGSAGFPGFWVATPASGTVIGASQVSWGAGTEPDSPSVAVEYSSDQDGGVFTELVDKGEQGSGTGWGVSDGSRYQFANVAKRRDRIRFRFTLSGAATSLVWRAVELLYRASGKQ
jgi:hypothetical protein